MKERKLNDTFSGKGSQPLILDRIQSPEELRKLSLNELEILCSELRQELISTVSLVGGHLASSLGVVELTVAVHKVFDTPTDRVVWDVGHQSYIHKMLTGRRRELKKVRQLGGISGFPRRSESEYDAFGSGHAGTSISAALGMCEASHHEYPGNVAHRSVAIIGDGALTSGMAFEALNHTGHLNRKLIVVLNDNEMSISPNVGALSRVFSRALTGKFSSAARRNFKHLVEKGVIPQRVYRVLDRAEEATQGLLSTPAMLFNVFHHRYLGPVDGHNLTQLIDALERAKVQDGPVLVHVRTIKGKGYEPAELDPVSYHGVEPFVTDCGDKRTPDVRQLPPSYTQVFGRSMLELCQQDTRIVGITAAMPHGTGLSLLAQEMPERFFDVGIAEEHAVTFAAGLACEGMRPVCAIYSTFLQRAFDQILHDVCIQSLPVVFALDRSGLVGPDGVTHHGVFDFSYLRILPNMTLMAPKDEAELRDMLVTAIAHNDGPIALRYPRGNGVGVSLERAAQVLPIGRGELLLRSARGQEQVLLIGIGTAVQWCLKAASELRQKFGIAASVLNARFVKPLDEELLAELISSHPFVFTVEENMRAGGFGSAVLEFMSDNRLLSRCEFHRLGIEDTFVEHGTSQELLSLCDLDLPAIVRAVLNALPRQKLQPTSLVVH